MMWKTFKASILLYVFSIPVFFGIPVSIVVFLTWLVDSNISWVDVRIAYCIILTIAEIGGLFCSKIKEQSERGEL